SFSRDWSSDVCSSDLIPAPRAGRPPPGPGPDLPGLPPLPAGRPSGAPRPAVVLRRRLPALHARRGNRHLPGTGRTPLRRRTGRRAVRLERRETAADPARGQPQALSCPGARGIVGRQRRACPPAADTVGRQIGGQESAVRPTDGTSLPL